MSTVRRSRRGRVLSSLALATALCLGAAACSSDSKTSTSGSSAASSSGSAAAVTFDGKIKIGFVADQTGTFSQFGVASYQATTLALKTINDAGGMSVGGKHYELELTTCETRGEEAGAQSCAVQIVEDEGAKFVFGGISKLSPVVMRVTEPNNAIYFTAASSASAYLGETKLMVTTLGTTTWRAESTLLAIKEFFPNAKNIGMVAEQDATLDQLQPVFEKVARNLGMTLVVQAVPTGTTDYTSALTNLKAQNPDIIIGIDNNPEQNAAIIRANNELAAAPALFGYSGSCPQAVSAGSTVPFVGQTFVGADLDYPNTDVSKEFAARFKEWSKDAQPKLLYSSLWNYDFYFVLAKAMEKAGSIDDTAKIYDALFEVSYEGVVGHIQFNRATKQALYGYTMCYTDGKTIDPSQFKYIDPTKYDLAALEK